MNSNRSSSAKGSSSDHLLASIGRASSLKRLFKDVITPADRAVLSQYLRELENDIARHDAEIQRLRAATCAAESRRRQLKNAFEMYNSLFAPIHRLPAEILHHVFSFCCDDLSILRAWRDPVVPTPVILTMVCSRWRELAISSSNLWTSIEFSHCSKEPYESGHRLNRMTQLFMARARNSPLRITFLVAEEEEGGLVQDPGFCLALDALCRRSAQWRHAYFHGYYTYEHPALELIRGNLPNLQFLGYEEEWGMDEAFALELTFLGPCPALRSLRLHLYLRERRFREDILEVPWHQLETLSLSLHPNTPSPLQILSKCRNLKDMTIESCQGFNTPDRTFEGHIVSNLNSLSINMHPRALIYVPFMERVTLSRLTFLDLYWTSSLPRETGCPEQPILDLLRRSSCPLTSLSLRSVPLSDDQVVRLLRALPGLRSLHVREGLDCFVDDLDASDPPGFQRPMPNVLCTSNLFEQLFVNIVGPASATKSPFLPRLEKLDIAVHGKTLDAEAFSEAMISRWIPDPELSARLGIDSIREVKVQFVDSAPKMPEGLERLRLFRSEGLRVELPEV